MRGTTGMATSRERLTGQFHALVRAWPTLLLTVLLAALALPAGMLVAPGLTGTAQSAPGPVQTPAWQLVPERLSVPQGIGPLSTTAPGRFTHIGAATPIPTTLQTRQHY